MALPLPPTYIGANAKDANPKATVAKCGRLVGSDSVAEHFPLISTRSRVGRRKGCRAGSCAASSGRQVAPVEPRRGAAEQIRLLGRTCRPGQNLAGIPERRVAIGALVDRTCVLIPDSDWISRHLACSALWSSGFFRDLAKRSSASASSESSTWADRNVLLMSE